MNPIFIFFFLMTFSVLNAQENSKVTPPVIVAKIPLGETIVFEEVTFCFYKVVEDSRCPSDVVCVWAGQAKVIAVITTHHEHTEKELIFHGTAFGTAAENTLFTHGNKVYIGYSLSPYPISTVHQENREYVLDIMIK